MNNSVITYGMIILGYYWFEQACRKFVLPCRKFVLHLGIRSNNTLSLIRHWR